MNDGVLGALWCAGLVAGFGVVMLLHGAGLPRTYARDLLHVGAGSWILGWSSWKGALVPVLIVWAVLAATAAVPWAASRGGVLRRAHDSVAGEGERWSGIVAYAASFAMLTTLAVAFRLLPAAACAAAALCAGDGLGGLVGRRFGRHRFAVPWSKAKSWEGTFAVAVFSTLGIVLAGRVLAFPVRWDQALLLGAVGAVAEALAPRASDNVGVPAAVLVVAMILL